MKQEKTKKLKNLPFVKENEILYPMALEVIKEKEIWQKMKVTADKIGYCCFTPEN